MTAINLLPRNSIDTAALTLERAFYLETSEKRNLAFYERLGFVVLEQAILGADGPPAWAMRREPQRGSTATA